MLASAFPLEDRIPSKLIERWSNLEYELVLSEHILGELADAWQKPYFVRRYSGQQVRRTLSLLRTQAIVISPSPAVHGIADDEEDDLVLATAAAGNVDYLVTGDRAMRALQTYLGISIRTPREFLELLDNMNR